MPKTKDGKREKPADPPEPTIDRTRERGSPGSGEDGGGAADLQPGDVEQGEIAR
jgi:hypothetical protein